MFHGKSVLQNLLFFAVLPLLYSVHAPPILFAADLNEPPRVASLRQVEQDRDRLLINTRQLINSVKDEMHNEAIRKANGLRNKIDDLESEYSPQLFQEIQQEARWVAMVFGTDVETMAGYYRLANLIINKVEPTQTQTLREAYGIRATESERAGAIEEYRQGLREKFAVSYLRHLIMESPQEALGGFRKYTEALRNLQVAEQFKTESEVMEVAANQQLVNDLASGVPLLSDAVDILGVVTGENPFTGENLSAAERSMNALMILVPEALEKLMEKSPQLSATFKKFVDKMEKADSATLSKLAKAMKKTPEQVAAMKAKLKQSLGMAENKSKRIMGEMVENYQGGKLLKKQEAFEESLKKMKKELDKTPEVSKGNKVWAVAEEQGKKKIENLDALMKKGDAPNPELLDAYQEFRKDKRALSQVRDESYLPLREKIQKLENDLFSHVDEAGKTTMGKVDVEAISDIKQGFKASPDPDELAKLRTKNPTDLAPDEIVQLKTAAAREEMLKDLKAHGQKNGVLPGSGYAEEALDFDNMEIRVFNATNKPPELGKVGFDRDISYQAVIPEKTVRVKNPRTGIIETKVIPEKKVYVPADLVEEHYNKSLYKNLNPDKPLPSRDALQEFGKKMDHQVTDAKHLESYRVGEEDITDFFKNPAMLSEKGVRIEDFGSTVTYKSQHLFDTAKKTRDPVEAMTTVGEGMRQASKQYDNYMTKLLSHQGMNAVDNVPEGLRKGIDIFRSVDKGKLTVPEAEAALKAIGQTKEGVVKAFGEYFESVVKLTQKKSAVQSLVKGGQVR